MRLALSSPLVFAALATCTPLATRADYGSWDFKGSVSFPSNGFKSYIVDATYTNNGLNSPVEVHCTYQYDPRVSPPQETASCSDESFSYDLGNVRLADPVTNVTLRQTVGLWGERVTVSGTKEFDWDFSAGSGKSGTAAGVIDVTTATA